MIEPTWHGIADPAHREFVRVAVAQFAAMGCLCTPVVAIDAYPRAVVVTSQCRHRRCLYADRPRVWRMEGQWFHAQLCPIVAPGPGGRRNGPALLALSPDWSRVLWQRKGDRP